MLSGGAEYQNPNAARWLKKYQINLDDDILVGRDICERSTLAWHHNLRDLMLGTSCGLEVSETVLNEQRNPGRH